MLKNISHDPERLNIQKFSDKEQAIFYENSLLAFDMRTLYQSMKQLGLDYDQRKYRDKL